MSLIVDRDKCTTTYAVERRLEQGNWVSIWDTFPTRHDATEYARRNLCAYPELRIVRIHTHVTYEVIDQTKEADR
jgi:hypothetical protein